MRLRSYAGTFAILDVIFQADPEFARLNVFGCESQVASTERVQSLDKVEHGLHGREMGIRSEVGGTVAHNFPCLEHTRKVFVAYANGRIAFVIFQQDVVAGLVFLDKVVFEQERIFFRVYHDVAYVGYPAHQNTGFCRVVVFRKIRVDTALQVLCLPHIDDGSLCIQVLVDARAGWQVHYDSPQVFVGLQFFHFRSSFEVTSRLGTRS